MTKKKIEEFTIFSGTYDEGADAKIIQDFLNRYSGSFTLDHRKDFTITLNKKFTDDGFEMTLKAKETETETIESRQLKIPFALTKVKAAAEN